MSLCDFYSRPRGQLPPISSHPKTYSIRKSARTYYSSSRGSAFDSRSARSVPVKKTPSRKRLIATKSRFDLPFTLPDLELGKCIGRGKGGRVLIGSFASREYAIKVISKDLLKYANIETEILERLDSHLIVKYFGRLEDESNFYIVLEYITGSDLFHMMRRQRLRQPTITNLAVQVLEGLSLLHSSGIVYRDLKPENLMVDDQLHVKFIDFGLSKVMVKDRTSTICGSPEYMAPEILRKMPYSFSVDIWAFGVLLFEMFCG
jgi:protein kinase A